MGRTLLVYREAGKAPSRRLPHDRARGGAPVRRVVRRRTIPWNASALVGCREWSFTRTELLDAFERYRRVVAEGGQVKPLTLNDTKRARYFAMLCYAILDEIRCPSQ